MEINYKKKIIYILLTVLMINYFLIPLKYALANQWEDNYTEYQYKLSVKNVDIYNGSENYVMFYSNSIFGIYYDGISNKYYLGSNTNNLYRVQYSGGQFYNPLQMQNGYINQNNANGFEIVWSNFAVPVAVNDINRNYMSETEYFYGTPDIRLTFTPQYLQMFRFTHPYYIFTYNEEYDTYYFLFSERPFYFNSDGYLHRSDKYILFNGTVQNYTVNWRSNFTESGSLTKVLWGLTTNDIIYNSFDIYSTDVTNLNTSNVNVYNNSSNNIILPSNPLGGEYDTRPYEYERDNTIPDFEDFRMDAFVDMSLGNSIIHKSQDLYEFFWKPKNNNYKIELYVQYGSNTGLVPISSRVEQKTWTLQNHTRHLIYDGKQLIDNGHFRFDKSILTKDLISNGLYTQEEIMNGFVVPQNIYLRYYIEDNENFIIRYGRYTKISLGYGMGLRWNVMTEYDSAIVDYTNRINNPDGTFYYEDIILDGSLSSNNKMQDFVGSAATDVIDASLNDYYTQYTFQENANLLNNVKNNVGQLPGLIGVLFSFLPAELINFMVIMIAFLFVLKVLHR